MGCGESGAFLLELGAGLEILDLKADKLTLSASDFEGFMRNERLTSQGDSSMDRTRNHNRAFFS